MLYYDWLREFDIMKDVETTYSTEVLIPTRWTGLFIIAGLIGIHILTTIMTFCLFALKTQTSTPGNVWPVLAQMVSPQTRLIMEKAHDMRDKDVKEWTELNGLHGRLYGVPRSKEMGRVELRCLE